MGHKILLADDSITIQKVIELTFSDEDFELHTVGNGQKAIDEIRSIMPHIVLCDIIMPEKNGYEVCEFIKTQADLKHIPVLLLTGAFEPFDQDRARAAGCDGFLAKPFEPQTLISKVKELLARAPSAAPPRPQPAAAPPASPPAAPRPPAAAARAPEPEADERTVFVPPSSRGAAPPAARGPQVAPPAPPPPSLPPAPMDFGSGLDDAFAVEAGERELMMDPGDHTVLLGSSGASSKTSRGGDDIWGEVVEPTSSEEPSRFEPSRFEEDDSSTVFMAAPPMAPPAQQPPAPARPPSYPGNEYEVQYEAEDLDSTWRMPGSDTPEISAPPDYGGFEEFAEPSPAPEEFAPPPLPETPVASVPPPPQYAPPPDSPFEMTAPVIASDPEPAAAGGDELYSPMTSAESDDATVFEPPRFDADATMGPADQDNYDRIPVSPAFESYGEPEILAESEPPAAAAFEAAPGPTPERFDEIESSDGSFGEYPEGPALVETASSVRIDDDLIEKVAQRVVDKLSKKVIQEIAWEVVPDLAEGLILKEIEALKAKIPK